MTNDVQQITCSFQTESALFTSYMPFLKGGGLFVRTNQCFPLGTPINLLVYLLQEPDPYCITAKVAWITPRGAQGNKPAGMGLQFTSENCRLFCNKIETYLAGMLKSAQLNDTM
ncbi:PilZ domain-containing protein [Legionella dresdenensis]|uniref:PilZ domain-containing protein n=1 Tax=Legionella dresdenensis TaxID=450200 RepID=A0ABV8CB12_9GAMM